MGLVPAFARAIPGPLSSGPCLAVMRLREADMLGHTALLMCF